MRPSHPFKLVVHDAEVHLRVLHVLESNYPRTTHMHDPLGCVCVCVCDHEETQLVESSLNSH